jgi:hypothetical protein
MDVCAEPNCLLSTSLLFLHDFNSNMALKIGTDLSQGLFVDIELRWLRFINRLLLSMVAKRIGNGGLWWCGSYGRNVVVMEIVMVVCGGW